MKETSKAYRRRKDDPFWKEVFVGKGIDVGSGDDPFQAEWFPGVESVKPFDLKDGDAQYIARYERPGSYDFLHASNCLEHLTSPMEALLGWLHVVKPGGHVVFTVPDEDLYEMGVFPSRWNGDHKWTFTFSKKSSWSPRSMNLADMLSKIPFCRIRRVGLVDTGYDRSLKDVDQTKEGAEVFWEVVLGKLPVEKRKRVFKHSGARGDLIYGLAVMREMGGGKLLVNRSEKPCHFVAPMEDVELVGVKELLEAQDYIDEVAEWKGQAIDADLDEFREMRRLDYNALSDSHLMQFGVVHDHREPWLDPAKVEPVHEADIVISRTHRYHGVFDWDELKPWMSQCAFVGTNKEHEDFQIRTGLAIKLLETPSWKALAGVIRGSKLFVGNQSFAYSLAEAMKVPRVLEAYPVCPNCDPQGPDGYLRLTQSVIRKYVEGLPSVEEPGKSRNPWTCIAFRPLRAIGLDRKRSLVIFGTPLKEKAVEFANEARAAGYSVFLPPGNSFEEAANRGAEQADGDVLCFADLSEGVTMSEVEAVLEQVEDGRSGMAASCISSRTARPHVSGPCFAVTRKAYELAGLFNSAMCPGVLNMLELGLRYAKYRLGCKTASVPGRYAWMGKVRPGDDERNAKYIEKVYGVKL